MIGVGCFDSTYRKRGEPMQNMAREAIMNGCFHGYMFPPKFCISLVCLWILVLPVKL